MKAVYSVHCALGQVNHQHWYVRLCGPEGVVARHYMGDSYAMPGKPDQQVAALEMIAAERIRVADTATAALEALDVLEAELRGMVVEGSLEWAAEQMKAGKKWCHDSAHREWRYDASTPQAPWLMRVGVALAWYGELPTELASGWTLAK